MRIQNDYPMVGKKRSSQTRVGFFLYRDASGELREWEETRDNENVPRLLVNCISTLLIKTSFRVVSVNIWRLLKKREGSCRKRSNQTKCEIGLKLISKPFLFEPLNTFIKYWNRGEVYLFETNTRITPKLHQIHTVFTIYIIKTVWFWCNFGVRFEIGFVCAFWVKSITKHENWFQIDIL